MLRAFIKKLSCTGGFRRALAAIPLALLCLGSTPLGQAAADPPKLSFRLRDITADSGVAFRHDAAASPEWYLIETMGGGVAWIDYDQDGWLDLFFVQSSPTPAYQPDEPLHHVLYRNLGDGTFADVTEDAGLGAPNTSFGMGAAVGDYDSDGDPDLLVAGYPRSQLLRNDSGKFVDVTDEAGVANQGEWGASAAFFDYDKDGHLDLFVANYMVWGYDQNIECNNPDHGVRTHCHPTMYPPAPSTLYRGNGDGTFTDVTTETGIGSDAGHGLGVLLADYDHDGWVDIFVANDAIRNFLFQNNGDGTFTEVGLEVGVAYGAEGKAEAGMGIAFGDYDRDGWEDYYITHLDMELHRLFRNAEDSFFTDTTYDAGLAARPNLFSGFGARFVDFDNDGWLDILQINGHVLPNVNMFFNNVTYAEPKQLWLNRGDGVFRDASSDVGEHFLRHTVGRGLATADFDNDGDIDFAVSSTGGTAELWRTDKENDNHWIALSLRGTQGHPDAIGARVTVWAGGARRVFQKVGGTSYLSASDPRIHIGLGGAGEVTRLRVDWPSGAVDELRDVSANQFVEIQEGSHPLPAVQPETETRND